MKELRGSLRERGGGVVVVQRIMLICSGLGF